MNYTNRFNLSDAFVHWLTTDDYDYNSDPSVISATTIMKPIRMVVLEQRWRDNITVDISDLVASRYGTAIHDSFEKCNIPNTIQEVRYYRDVDENFTLSGKVDLVLYTDRDIQTVADIKSTSVWNYLLNKRDEDYIAQLSMYKWLMENGTYKDEDGTHAANIETTDYAEIKYIFTDWSKQESIRNPKYPQSRVLEKRIPLNSLEDTEAKVKARCAEITKARELGDNMLPECTKEELWQTDTTYAVKKRGSKRATKVHKTYADAIKHQRSYKTPDYFVETREGKVKRCNYCNVREFCNQHKRLLSENLID